MMKRLVWVIAALAMAGVGATRLLALDQAMPAHEADAHAGLIVPPPPSARQSAEEQIETEMEAFYGKQDREAFESGVNLDDLRLLPMMHDDTIKIMDSWARQSLSKIYHGQSVEGKGALLAVLDMAARPQAWRNKNIIYVQAVPVRQSLAEFAPTKEEGQRIIREGRVSPQYLSRPNIQEALEVLSQDARKSKAVGTVWEAYLTFKQLTGFLIIVPPPPGEEHWHHPFEFQASAAATSPANDPLAGYTKEQRLRIQMGMEKLGSGWQQNDVKEANEGIAMLAAILPTVNPEAMPSHAKRVAELWYNKTFNGTIADVFLYFLALTLFLMVAVGVTRKVETTALVVFAIALALHLTAMGWDPLESTCRHASLSIL